MNKGQDRAVRVLNLSGFFRRMPRAVIRWQLDKLNANECLSLVVNMEIDEAILQRALLACGAEVVADEIRDDLRQLTLQRQPGSGTILELDMRGRRCPAPVIEARRSLSRMVSGERLQMIADCTGATVEVGTWAAHSANVVLLGQWEQPQGHVFLLERRLANA